MLEVMSEVIDFLHYMSSMKMSNESCVALMRAKFIDISAYNMDGRCHQWT